jgi:hypothetical protein
MMNIITLIHVCLTDKHLNTCERMFIYTLKYFVRDSTGNCSLYITIVCRDVYFSQFFILVMLSEE